MAVNNTVKRSIVAAKMIGGSSTETRIGPEKASQTFTKGAVLILSAGFIATAAADAVANVLGIAAEAAHNDSVSGTHQIRYYPALPNMIFQATLEDETNVDHALVATNRYVSYSMQVDPGNGNWYLDENDTANGIGVIDDLIDPIGTVRGRVLFHFENGATIYA